MLFNKYFLLNLQFKFQYFHRNSVQCNILNCKQRFDSVFAYESHYNALHRFLCAQCSKNLPSAHLLDLHLSEKHDSFFAVLSERQPMVSVLKADIHSKPLLINNNNNR